jgi:hypothetical protein
MQHALHAYILVKLFITLHDAGSVPDRVLLTRTLRRRPRKHAPACHAAHAATTGA